MSDDEKTALGATAEPAAPKKKAATKKARTTAAAHRPTTAEPWKVKKWHDQNGVAHDLYVCAGRLPNGRPCNYDTFILAEMEDHARKHHPGA